MSLSHKCGRPNYSRVTKREDGAVDFVHRKGSAMGTNDGSMRGREKPSTRVMPINASNTQRGTAGRYVGYVFVLVHGFVLIYIPARLLFWSNVVRPATIGILQIAGLVLGLPGALLALWCVSSFAFVGRGTPAPFVPPRRLVTRGPYRFVRNPMYIGAGLTLAGAAVFFKSLPLLGYTGLFVLSSHLFVVWYEEPVLRRTFGQEYDAYCGRVRRWWPRLRA
jgi:protein-S-isoprenylcysteine O-methyltransferase Ste14